MSNQKSCQTSSKYSDSPEYVLTRIRGIKMHINFNAAYTKQCLHIYTAYIGSLHTDIKLTLKHKVAQFTLNSRLVQDHIRL